VLVEARLAPKVSVARVTGDSNPLERSRGARHAVAALLIAYVRDVTFTPFIARPVDATFRHRACYICNHVVVVFHFVVQKVYSLFRLHLAVKIYRVTVQTQKYDDSILVEVLLESLDFSDPSTLIQIDTCHLE
jgi:hypothetical protein